MVNKFQKGLSGTIQDVPQIKALRTPLHVGSSELFEGKVTLKESCAQVSTTSASRNFLKKKLATLFGGYTARLSMSNDELLARRILWEKNPWTTSSLISIVQCRPLNRSVVLSTKT